MTYRSNRCGTSRFNNMNYMNNMYNMNNMPMSSRYRGMMEPMSRMTMDFQGRYMDSQGNMVDPGYYDYYGRNNDYDRYYRRPMYSYTPMMGSDRYDRNYNGMDYPERYMDMSGYQMDMYGRWMDMQGSRRNPSMGRFYNW